MIKIILKKILPASVLELFLNFYSKIKIFNQYLYDFKIYNSFHGNNLVRNLYQIEGKIIENYHVLEKGMSHPTPKQLFSLPVVLNLCKLIDEYDKLSTFRSNQVNIALSVLQQYKNFHTNKDHIPKEISEKIKNFENKKEILSGFLTYTKDQFFEKINSPFDEFALSRSSLRDFTNKEINLDSLKKAIKIAQKTPSVCNRQSISVYILTKRDDIKKHLELQSGNRGFGDKINKLLIVTSNIYYFSGPNERNQAFIDGGMFLMSLLYAIHNQKIGAVPLNWSYVSKQDKSLHNLGIIPFNEKVISFIGVGDAPESFKVAASIRRNIDEITKII